MPKSKSNPSVVRKCKSTEELQMSLDCDKIHRSTNDDDDNNFSSSSGETTDDDIGPDNAEFDLDFYRSMGALHSKDPECISKEKNFFKDAYESTVKKNTDEKPMTLKDFERYTIVNRAGQLDDNDCDIKGKPTIDVTSDEQHGFSKFEINSEDDDDGDDDDGLFASGLFKKTEKQSRELDRQKKNNEIPMKTSSSALEYLKGNTSTVDNEKDEPLLKSLKVAWSNPGMSKNDQWLVDYFVHQRYLEDDNEGVDRAYNHVIIDEETLSEDDETLKKMEDFETKYRFRYEEPDEDFIKTYPRIMTDAVRLKDNKRKEDRKRTKKRKEKEKLQKHQEVEGLKAAKLEEIQHKIKQIKAIAGSEYLELNAKDFDLDGDFDPAAHDAAMSQAFSDNYYEGSEQDNEAMNNLWTEETESSPSTVGHYEESTSAGSNEPTSSGRKGKTLECDEKTEEEEACYDDYYKLDFEDVISGMPCRFKYKKVVPNNFGLDTATILRADDKELNRWYSIKKLSKYDRSEDLEKKDYVYYNRRAANSRVQQLFPTLFNEQNVDTVHNEEEKKRNKNLKKKLRRKRKAEGTIVEEASKKQRLDDDNNGSSLPHDEEFSNVSKKKAKKHLLSQPENNVMNNQVINTVTSEIPLNTEESILSHPKKSRKRKKNKLSNIDEKMLCKDSLIENTMERKSLNIESDAAISPCNVLSDQTSQNKKLTKPKKKDKKRKFDCNFNKDTEHKMEGVKESYQKKYGSNKTTEHQHSNDKNTLLKSVGDFRLLAYGQNPKKAKNKIKYSKH